MNGIKESVICHTISPRKSKGSVMTVSDKKKIYDCTTCPYPRYKDGSIIFCDVCMRRILDEQKAKKKGKEQRDE